MRPRLVETLTGRIAVPADAVVAAGQTASFCTIVGGQIFAWGKLKPSGACLGRGGGQRCVEGCGCGAGGWVGGWLCTHCVQGHILSCGPSGEGRMHGRMGGWVGG